MAINLAADPMETAMNTRQLFSVTLAVVLGILLSSPAGAADLKHGRIEREALLARLERGPEFSSQGITYQLVTNARALKQDFRENPDQALARADLGKQDLIDQKAGFLVVRGNVSAATAIDTPRGERLYPVALNTRSGQLGIVTGTIVARLKDPAVATSVAENHGLTLIRAYPHLGYAYYKAPATRDVLAAAGALAGDARVQQADVEVVENLRLPK